MFPLTAADRWSSHFDCKLKYIVNSVACCLVPLLPPLTAVDDAARAALAEYRARLDVILGLRLQL